MIRFKRKSFTSLVNKKNVSLGSEEDLQKQCNDWMNARYPEFTELFYFHAIQGFKLPQKTPQQKRLKFMVLKQLKDLGGLKENILDFEFHKNNGKYSSLFIELKIESPFGEKGQVLKKGKALPQSYTIEKLKDEGHYACFCWSLEQFKKTVTDYMECRL
jgi:hypothetical protein